MGLIAASFYVILCWLLMYYKLRLGGRPSYHIISYYYCTVSYHMHTMHHITTSALQMDDIGRQGALGRSCHGMVTCYRTCSYCIRIRRTARLAHPMHADMRFSVWPPPSFLPSMQEAKARPGQGHINQYFLSKNVHLHAASSVFTQRLLHLCLLHSPPILQ